MWAAGFFALTVIRLRSLVLAVWALLSPAAAQSPDAPAIATAIATVVASQPSPVWSSEIDSAVAAVYVYYESRVQLNPVPAINPATGKPWDGLASGAYQLHSSAGRGDARTQTAAWFALLKLGATSCKDSPAAPLSGGCATCKGIAGRRVSLATHLVNVVKQQESEESSR